MYFIIDFLVFLFFILLGCAVAAGVLYLLYRLKKLGNEKHYKKVMKDTYLPMIKDKDVREFIAAYESEAMRILTLSYLCFRGKEGKDELEEILVDLAESIPYAVESGSSEYVDSVLHSLGDRGVHVRFNRKNEFQYSMKY